MRRSPFHAAQVAPVLVAVGLAVISPARAEVWVGAWDPTYSPSGTPFNTSLGWNGTVTVDVPSNCNITGVGIEVKNNTSDCQSPAGPGRAWVKKAEVDFYDVSAPNTIIGSIVWNFLNLTDAEVTNSVVISNIEFVNGILTNISTTPFPDLLAPGAVFSYDTVSGYVPDTFSLQFLLSGSPSVFPPIAGSYSGPVLFSTFIEDDCGGDCGTLSYRSEVELEKGRPRNFRFVPEPGSALLVASALLMAAAGGRRRFPPLQRSGT